MSPADILRAQLAALSMSPGPAQFISPNAFEQQQQPGAIPSPPPNGTLEFLGWQRKWGDQYRYAQQQQSTGHPLDDHLLNAQRPRSGIGGVMDVRQQLLDALATQPR